MTSPFRVVGSQNFTEGAFATLDMDVRSSSVLGKSAAATTASAAATASKAVAGTAVKTVRAGGAVAAPAARKVQASMGWRDDEEESPKAPRRPKAGGSGHSKQANDAVSHAKTRAESARSPRGRKGPSARRGGPTPARTVRAARPASSVVARNNSAAMGRGASGVGSTSKGFLPRAFGGIQRATNNVVARLVHFVRRTQGVAAVASSPAGWLIGGGVALLLLISVFGGMISAVGTIGSASGSTCYGEAEIPEGAGEWVNAAVASSGLPADFLARMISRESDWRPDIYAHDVNGGTWGLFQINRSEWARYHPSASGTPPTGITDPLQHSKTAGELLRAHYDRFLVLREAQPNAAWASLDPLAAVVIMHNAGEGALMRYPNIPAITKDYLAEVVPNPGANPGEVTAGTGMCIPNGGVTVNAQGWASPSTGQITSSFGWRMHPIYHTMRLHSGTDLSAGCGNPIHAAQSGTVTMAGFDPNGNGTIIIDHGGGVTTRYLHMYSAGILVRPGQVVTGGQHIGNEGSSGQSSGCHLHFEVRLNGEPVDAVPFMKQQGIQL